MMPNLMSQISSWSEACNNNFKTTKVRQIAHWLNSPRMVVAADCQWVEIFLPNRQGSFVIDMVRNHPGKAAVSLMFAAIIPAAVQVILPHKVLPHEVR